VLLLLLLLLLFWLGSLGFFYFYYYYYYYFFNSQYSDCLALFHVQDIDAGSIAEHWVEREISKIIIHPQYNRKWGDYDVAVWQLSTPAPSGYTPIPLDVNGTTAVQGTTGSLLGWGEQDQAGDFSTILNEVSVPVYNTSQCTYVYDKITAQMLCVGFPQGGAGMCDGDQDMLSIIPISISIYYFKNFIIIFLSLKVALFSSTTMAPRPRLASLVIHLGAVWKASPLYLPVFIL
jgi:hypothetical protein